MKNIFSKISFIGVVLTLISFSYSCSNIEKGESLNTCSDSKNLYTLERDTLTSISFTLDSLTSPAISYLKMKEIDDTLYFTFLNNYTNSLYFYDYNSRQLRKQIKLIGNKKITGYEIINWDSIVTYQYSTQKLILQGSNFEKIKEVVVPLEEGKNGYYALPTPASPVTYTDGNIYLVGGHSTTEKANDLSHSAVQVDMSFRKFDYILNYPEIYNKYFFGGSHYRMDVSYDYNAEKKLFIFSFPASHELITTKDFQNMEVHCAGSKFVESIPNYRYNDWDKRFKYVAENAFYHRIIYDRYNRCYYRICLLPVPTPWNIEKEYTRDLSVIILDENFEVIGEKVMKNGEDYALSNLAAITVSPDGLLFQIKNELGNEESINYKAYKLIKK